MTGCVDARVSKFTPAGCPVLPPSYESQQQGVDDGRSQDCGGVLPGLLHQARQDLEERIVGEGD